MMTNKEFVAKLKEIATKYKTLYVMGCFGAPLTGANVARYCNNDSYNKLTARTNMIKAAANQNPPVYGFDCVCLIKGVLWGWSGDAAKTYGGATYKSSNVPDIGADTMIKKCVGLSTNFGNIEIGEAVWMPGHIGIYIGDGLVVECSPAFENKVQITSVGPKAGYNARTWTKHGKLPYIQYIAKAPKPAKKTVAEIAKEVIVGKWGNGDERKKKLTAAGYNYKEVQNKVNELMTQKKSTTEIAREVIAGKWGNGSERRRRLIKAGYDAAAVQAMVNKLLR